MIMQETDSQAGERARSVYQRGERTDAESPPAHGGRQGQGNANLRLQEENRRSGNQTQATTKLVSKIEFKAKE